ncbi:MAG: glycosyltransferase [Patescibacteria group bacterium]
MPKIAIIHDYLNAYGGAESVVNAIWELFDKPPIYTALWNPKAFEGTKAFENADIRVPKWAGFPFVNKFYKYLVPLYPLMFERLNLSDFDIILSSSANFAKGVKTNKGQLHISYIHTPPRFLYGYPTETVKRDVWYWKPILKVVDYFLLRWDQKAAQRPDFLLCNSKEVKLRIKKFYKRDAEIIPPFLSLNKDYEEIKAEGGDYYLIITRMSLYKNPDKVILACKELGRSLKVAGNGKEFERFKKIAEDVSSNKGKIEMLGFVSEKRKTALLKGCRAFIYPVEYEDFGMAPLEAMYFGKPAIVLNQGGLKDYLVEEYNGIYIQKPTVEGVANAIKKFEGMEKKVNWEKNCKKTAERYTKEQFQHKLKEFVEEKWEKASQMLNVKCQNHI